MHLFFFNAVLIVFNISDATKMAFIFESRKINEISST